MQNYKILLYKKKLYILALLFFNPHALGFQSTRPLNYDISVIGYANQAHGIGSITVGILNCLKDSKLKISFISSTKNQNLNEIPKEIDRTNPNIQSNISIFTDILSGLGEYHHKFVPKNSLIKIAYSMLEGTLIPKEWTDILNNNFDAVVVPDKWLISVYKNSGVEIPIFVLPIMVNLDEFLKEKLPNRQNNEFVFGNTCSIIPRKNHLKLIEVFAEVFKNSQNIKLKINSGTFELKTLKKLYRRIKELNLTNVEITTKKLSRIEYINFMKSFNCYISLSRGEGFAIPPREALALGIPTILSNNTAHSTICDAGLALPVEAKFIRPATYFIFNFHKTQIGYNFDFKKDAAAKAIKNMYVNYPKYLKAAQNNRECIKQYEQNFLQKRFLNLLNPKKIILGKENFITDDFIMTNSTKLYEKYLKIIKNKNI